MAVTPQSEFRRWKRELDLADKREKDWRAQGKKIYDRYRGKEKRKNSFNILWANTEVLRPALYNSTPKPDVRRRFRDDDPVGKAVSEVLERSLTYSVDAYDLNACVKFDVLDSLLPGRGTSRVRYVPSFRESEASEADDQVSELEYEQVLCEHVDWEHLRHGYGKTWPEVQWVAFWCQLNKKDAAEKFGDDIAQGVKYDEVREDDEARKADQDTTDIDRVADFWEVWDKQNEKVFFVQKSFTNGLIYPLDNPDGEAPFEVAGFFPIPEPLKIVEDSSSLLPIPLWNLYQEQANELDLLSARINRVINALKVRGVYDATLSEMAGIMSGEDNDLIPLANASAFKNAGGLEKAIWWMPIEQAAKVLRELYDGRERCKQVIFEITGLSDIIRGQSNPNETLGAQKIKANYSSLRLQRMQREVQRYVRDLIRMMGEIIGDQFQPETLQQMTGLKFPDEQQKAQMQMQAQQMQQQGQPIPDDMQASLKLPTWAEVMTVLKSDDLRQFRVDIETDSTVQDALDSDMQGMQEVLTGIVKLWQGVGPAVQAGAIKMDTVKQLTLAVVRRARMGMAVEDALENGMQQPRQQGDPAAAQAHMEQQKQQAQIQHEQAVEQFKAQAQGQIEQVKAQAMQAGEAARVQADIQIEQARAQTTAQIEQMKMAAQAQVDEAKRTHEAMLKKLEQDSEERMEAQRLAFEHWKVEYDGGIKVLTAQISAKAGLDQAALSAQHAADADVSGEDAEAPDQIAPLVEMHAKTMDSHGKMVEAINGVMAQLARPKTRTIITDPETGKPTGMTEE
jgi:hypothetical protein